MLQGIIDAIGFGLCHQLPERTLVASGLRIPVCARDTGIYVGFLAALVLIALLEKDRPSHPPRMWLSVLLGLGLFAMVADGASSYLGVRLTSNELRLATGLAAGFAIAAWVTPMLSSQLWERPGSGRVLESAGATGIFLLGIPVTYALVWWLLPLSGAAFSLFVVVAILVTFTAVNMVIVCLLPPFERRAVVFTDALPAIGIAFALAVIELWASAALKAWLISVVS